MLADYMAVVRANGDWAIRNLARLEPDDDYEVTYEVLETAEARRPSAMRFYTDNGDLSDAAWDMANWAASAAIDLCKLLATQAGMDLKEEP
jgi:hypothetical protein